MSGKLHNPVDNQTTLITGATGLLGSHVVIEASRRGLRVAGVSLKRRLRWNGVSSHCVDLRDASATRMLFTELRPSVVIHCAAEVRVDWCEDHPEEAHASNVTASSNVAEAASNVGAKCVYVSTDSVFDGRSAPYSETGTPRPLNVYAHTKLEGEFAFAHAVPGTFIARTNLFGFSPNAQPTLAEWIIAKLAANESVPGWIDVFFSPLLANDVAALLLDAVDRGLEGVYNVSSSQSVSKFEFARNLAKRCGYNPELVSATKMSDTKLRAARPHDTSLNPAKLAEALGRPMPTFDEAMIRFMELRSSGFPESLKNMCERCAE